MFLLVVYEMNENQGEDVQVCKALDEMFEEAKNNGVKQGIEKGIEKGIAQGALDNQRKMYQKMLNKGFTIEKMADIFSVSVESIQKLITQ